MQHIKWPKITKFSDIIKLARKQGYSKFSYRAKIKLHGTNAAIQVHPDGTVVAQSRNRIITPDNDNYGFATWVEQTKDYWSSLTYGVPTILYGEWFGPGIQNGVACSMVPEKSFALFSVTDYFSENVQVHVDDPSAIYRVLNSIEETPKNVYVLPYERPFVSLAFDLNNSSSVEYFVSYVNDWVETVGKCDPWVKRTFGIEGPGEGLVFYPGYPNDYDYLFKAKSEEFSSDKLKKPATVNPDIAASVQEFVSIAVTENRLTQALNESCEGDKIKNKLGLFLSWLSKDIKTELSNEMEASNLKWRDVSPDVVKVAKEWFFS